MKKISLLLVGLALLTGCFSEKDNKEDEKQNNIEFRTGYIEIAGEYEKISYIRKNGKNIYADDVILADDRIIDEVNLPIEKRGAAVSNKKGCRGGWAPKIKFVIDSSIESKRSEILKAISMIEASTYIKFEEGYPNVPIEANSVAPEIRDSMTIDDRDKSYIFFKSNGAADTCYSSGIGTRTSIKITSDKNANIIALSTLTWANYGVVVHEILHALGMWHEQSRQDRDNYININYDNIEPNNEWYYSLLGIRDGNKYQFDKHGYDIGIFSFDSIMLYSSWSFSKNGLPVMTDKNGNAFYSQRNHLGATDIETLNYLFPKESYIYKIEVSGTALTGSHYVPYNPAYYYGAPMPNCGYSIVGNQAYKTIKATERTMPLYKVTNDSISLNRGIAPGETFEIKGYQENSGSGSKTFKFIDQYGNTLSTITISFKSIADIVSGNPYTPKGISGGGGITYEKFVKFYFDGTKVTYTNDIKGSY